jgi:hypothetical protein
MESGRFPTEIRTFGDFFAFLEKTDNFNGQLWLQDIREDVSDEEWDKAAARSLDSEMVGRLIDGVRIALQIELGHLSDAEHYEYTRQKGDEFVLEIKDRAKELGIDLESDKESPTALAIVQQAEKESDGELRITSGLSGHGEPSYDQREAEKRARAVLRRVIDSQE